MFINTIITSTNNKTIIFISMICVPLTAVQVLKQVKYLYQLKTTQKIEMNFLFIAGVIETKLLIIFLIVYPMEKCRVKGETLLEVMDKNHVIVHRVNSENFF